MNQYIAQGLNISLIDLFRAAATQLDIPAHELLDNCLNPPEEHEGGFSEYDSVNYCEGEQMGVFYLLNKMIKDLPQERINTLRIALMRD